FEAKAAGYLKKKGFEITAVNYETKFGEIDIVAEKKKENLIVFVEVKAREDYTGAHPLEAVDRRKQNVIIRCARAYMMENNVEGKYIRFDVAGLLTSGKHIVSMEYIEDAFQA
ncbi:MAG TPA: YraN family protein, partial [Candidatus Goldiibacteriota bacterium]|nr:YraN family protein [Candidatus Goldiibacteriota bacterium]